MKVGIVGAEGTKFTPAGERRARHLIRSVLTPGDIVVSGGCHLGGIDIWAIEEAKILGIATREYPPRIREWASYKARNIQIAKASDKVICITLTELPAGYIGMRFHNCYHCGVNTHVKSGGCWTVKYAKQLGKPGEVIVI